MPGARPSSYRRGGNRIFTGDAVILDYTINDEFNGKPYDPKHLTPDKKPYFHWLFVHLTAKFDGADAPSSKSFKIAGANDWSTDGKTLTPNGDDQALGATAKWQVLMDSLVAAGFPEDKLPEDEVNYEGIIGARVRFGSRIDEWAKKQGRKQVNKKTKKEYDPEDIVVEQFYGFEAVKGAKPVGKAATRGNGRAANGADIDALAQETLLSIIADAGGETKKSSLSLAVLKAMTAHPQRDDVRKKLGDDSFLAQQLGWSYDKQTGVVALA